MKKPDKSRKYYNRRYKKKNKMGPKRDNRPKYTCLFFIRKMINSRKNTNVF